MSGVDGQLFAPGYAQSSLARLTRKGDTLCLSTTAGETTAPIAQLKISPALGAAQRRVEWPNGWVFVTFDAKGLEALLGRAPTPARRLALAAAIVIGLVLTGLGLWFGLPAAADLAAALTPPALERELGAMTVRALEHETKPSAATEAQRAAALAVAARLQGDAPLTLVIRDGGKIGANALATPGGTVVVTDQLLRLLAGDDEALLAVLAHEQGHVARRHGLRVMARSALIALAFGVLVGDVGSLTAVVADFGHQIAVNAYTRDFEREADAFAAEKLHRLGVSPLALARALEKLAANDKSHAEPPAYLSSHPPTAERVAALKTLAEQAGYK